MLIYPDSWVHQQWVRAKKGGKIFQADFDYQTIETNSTLAINCFNLLTRIVGLKKGHPGINCTVGFDPSGLYDTRGVVSRGKGRRRKMKWWTKFVDEFPVLKEMTYTKSFQWFRNLFRAGREKEMM